MKVCSRCHIEKEDSEFRLRYDKRGRGSAALKYLNNTCRKCDAEISNKHYFKNKPDAIFRENWKKKSRDYYAAHREEMKEKMRQKRKTPEYKVMMKAYREKNKEKIRQQEIITKKRYHEKNRDAVTDEYVINQLVSQDVATREMLEQPENYPLIQAKRLQILIKRKITQNE